MASAGFASPMPGVNARGHDPQRGRALAGAQGRHRLVPAMRASIRARAERRDWPVVRMVVGQGMVRSSGASRFGNRVRRPRRSPASTIKDEGAWIVNVVSRMI